MQYLKEQAMARVNIRAMTQFLSLAGVATILPFFIHLQWVTGPIVNAILIIALFLVGIRSALVICLLPSLMALSGGLLPAILAPVVPFIMIGNVIFVLSIDWIYNNRIKLATILRSGSDHANVNNEENKNYWLGIIVGAGLKFIFLFASINFISRLLIKQELAVKVAQMMSWPQMATAVAGGMIAWVALKWLKRI